MNNEFDKIKISERLWPSFTLKPLWFVMLIVLATIVWASVVWLSPSTSGTGNGMAEAQKNERENLIETSATKHSNIAASKKTSTKAFNTENSQVELLVEPDDQTSLAPMAVEGHKTRMNEHNKNTKPIETKTESGSTPPEAQKGLLISGMVVDHSGNPVPNITLIALQKKHAIENRDMDVPASKRHQETTTESDGFYQIGGLEYGEYEILSKISDLYQEASIVVHTGVESADLILRKKQPDIRVYGTVQSVGELLEKVRIMPFGQSKNEVYTDAEGRFDLVVDTSSRLKVYPLRISHQDYKVLISELRSEEMQGQEGIELNLEMEPINEQAEVTGFLRSANGSVVSEEKIQLYSKTTKRSYFAVSDQDGAFWFPEVAPATDYFISVHPAAYYQDYQQKDVQIISPGKDVNIVLKPLKLGKLTGKMVDPDDQPIANFSLWLHINGASSFPAVEVFSDSLGQFNVNEIPEGKLVFDTRSSPLFSITGINQSAGEKKELKLVLDWGNHKVTGRIVDSHDEPIPASEPILTWFHRDGEIRSYSTRKAVTDKEGYFMFSKVAPGMHTLRINIPGYSYTQRDYIVGSTATNIIIRLEKLLPPVAANNELDPLITVNSSGD